MNRCMRLYRVMFFSLLAFSSYMTAAIGATMHGPCIFTVNKNQSLSDKQWETCAIQMIQNQLASEKNWVHPFAKQNFKIIDLLKNSVEERTFTLSFFNRNEKNFGFFVELDGEIVAGEIILKQTVLSNSNFSYQDIHNNFSLRFEQKKMMSIDLSSHCPDDFRSYEFLLESSNGYPIKQLARLKPQQVCINEAAAN